MRSAMVLLVAAVLAAGCGVLGGDEEDVMAVWDLRDTRAVEAVGWPEDAGSAFETNSGEGLERILLPGDVTIEGDYRVNVDRQGGLLGRPHEDHIYSLSVTFSRRPVEEVADLAAEWGDRLGVEIDRIRAWAAANADGQDLGPGGATALSGRTTLGADGPSAQLATRAFTNGGAVLRILVTWPSIHEPSPSEAPS